MNVLIIAAHADDEILGCGGITNLYRSRGYIVTEFCFSHRNTLLDQKFDTKPLIQWITDIEGLVQNFQPDIVFTHYRYDLNRDHQIIAEATEVACRYNVKELYAYEVLSSTELSKIPFNPDFFVSLRDKDMAYKLKTMQQKYPDELRKYPHPRSLVGIETLARYRGMQIKKRYAEAFMIIREKTY